MLSHYGNGLQYSDVGLAMHSHCGNGLQYSEVGLPCILTMVIVYSTQMLFGHAFHFNYV